MSTTFTIRSARTDDVETAAALLNDLSRALHGTDDTSAAELLNYWETPDVDLEKDVLLAEAADGALIGYADVGIYGDAVWLDVRGRDAEPLAALLSAIEARGAEKKPGKRLLGYVTEKDRAVRDLYTRNGYRVIRHGFRMEIDLDGPLVEPQWPEGIAVRTFQDGDEQGVYEAHMESFADTWMFWRTPFDEWTHWFLKDPAFDPSLWFLAEANEELVGVALTRPSESEPDTGWIRVLGVVPAHRRRGLAQALLHRAFAEFASRGFKRVGLGVDAENPTGAVRLYERAGMHVARVNLQYERVQP